MSRVSHHIECVKQDRGLTTVRLLDIGGGGGGRVFKVFGHRPDVDFNVLDLRCLTDNEQCTFHKGDITDPDLALPGQFDVIVTFDTFEHILNPWDATNNVLRFLADNGRFIFHTPFSWRYHPVPYDAYRYTHTGARYLFERLGGMQCIETAYVPCGNTNGIWKNKKDATMNGKPFPNSLEVFYVARRDSSKVFDLAELDADHDGLHMT